MKILLYSDLHVSHRNREYMGFLEKTLAYLKDVVDSHKVSWVFNLGDTFDTFGTLDLRDAVWAVDAMREITRFTDGRHLVLRGNHDTGDKLGQLASTSLIAEGTRVVNDPEVIDVESLRIGCLPYSSDVDGLTESLRAMVPKSKVILAHTDWVGCRLTSVYTSQSGLSPADAQVSIPVFSGHYHTPMEVGNVWFVGSPLHMTFNDEVGGIPRGFTVWDTETGSRIRIPNPHTYECWTFRAEDKRALTKALSAIRGREDKCRVRVYVPKRLLADAVDKVSGCLWHAVYPLDNEREAVEFTTPVGLDTPPEEIIENTVRAAPEGLNPEMVRAYGRTLFQV